MGDFGYANARLRAMKGRLFSRTNYDELLALERIDDVIAHLAQSPYAPEIDVALARYTGLRVVLEGCRLHLANTLRAIRSFFDADDVYLVRTLLARYDLHNIKALLRAQQADAAPDEILPALVPAGDLDDNALRALAHAGDATTTVELLRAWNVQYARLARTALAAWRASGEWQSFETTLDPLFGKLLVEQLGDGKNDRYVRELLQREVDATNLLTALRLRRTVSVRDEAGLAGQFLPGGQVARVWLHELARAPRDDLALAVVGQSRFSEELGDLGNLDIGEAQRALDRHLARFGQSYWQRDPLSIAPAIAYLAAKRVEVANVRVIAQGVALGLHRAEIELGVI